MAIYLVTTTQDENDQGATVASPGGSGLSLREALALANADPAADTIRFADGAGQAFENGGSIFLTQGIQLEISSDVTIEGSFVTGNFGTAAGVQALIGIYANSAPGVADATSRVFLINNSSEVFLQGLLISGGDSGAGRGGGILISGGASLELMYSVVSQNSSDNSGGGIYNDASNLLLNYVTVIANRAESLGGGVGSNGGTTDFYASDILNNETNFSGGGISVRNGGSSIVGYRSIVYGNSAPKYGGGIYINNGELILGAGFVGFNSSSQGAGIYLGNGSRLYSNRSTISYNTARISGGGIYSADSMYTTVSEAELKNTTISGNSAVMESGGGIYSNGNLTLLNSTVSGNAAYKYGGGIAVTSGNPVLTNSIILGNTAFNDPEIFSSGGYTNTAGLSIVGGVNPADVFADINVESPSGSGGQLATNGGPVPTIALLNTTSNPAIDAGDDALAPDVDARNLSRIDFPGAANNTGNTSDLGAFEVQGSEARSLVVTTTADVVDGFDGETSLREAIRFANDIADADGDGSSNDTITFASGLGEEFEFGGRIFLTQGTEIVIDSDVTVDGDLDDDGSPDVTVDADSSLGEDDATSRVLLISGGNAVVDGLSITSGNAGPGQGGGILIENGAALALSNSLVFSNSASNGGGLFAFDGTTVELTNTGVLTNTAAQGGGVFTLGTMTLIDSSVTGNAATFGGGGIANGTYNRSGGYTFGGTLNLTNTNVIGNEASDGGGILNVGIATVTDSTIRNNEAGNAGGGISNLGESLEVHRTVIGYNSAAYGGGIFGSSQFVAGTTTNIANSAVISNDAGSGGGLYIVNSIANVVNTVINMNTAKDGPLISRGGGILVFGTAQFELTQSTVSDNTAEIRGGGIYDGTFDGGFLSLTNITISGNTAALGGGIYSGASEFSGGARTTITNSTVSGNHAYYSGGGLYNSNMYGTTTLTNSIVLGNSADTSGDNTQGTIGNTNNLSIIGGFDPAAVFAEIDPTTPSGNGGLLADNGGPVQTIALLSDAANPALDAGDDSDAPAQDAAGFSRFDQQDVSNNGGNISDLGSFELQTQVGEEASLDPQWRLLTTDGFIGDFGGSGEIFGTGAIQNIGIVDLPGAIAFDPSFNRGGDIIRLPGSAADWTIMRFGSSAILSDGDTSTTIPLGTEGLLTIFDDGDRLLRFDTSDSTFRIGAQEFADAAVTITAPGQVLDFPIESFPNPFGRLLFFPDGEVTAGANGLLDIVGTAGTETVTALFGDIQLDPSFNRGGDVLELILPAPSFTAVRIGSALKLESASTNVFVPLGTTGMTTIFNSADDRLIVFDTLAGTALVGTQPIGFDAAALSAIA